MPELPEVESLRLGLVKALVGAKIKKVKVTKPKIVSASGTVRKENKLKVKEFEAELAGRKIESIERRAKNLIFKFDNASLMLVHLKMTGQLVFVGNEKDQKIGGGHPIQESTQDLPHKHTHIIFELDNGNLYYNDVRQFGYLLYFKNEEEFEKQDHFKGIGAEPLSDEFEYNTFAAKLKKKDSPIKVVLLDQTVVVGCGNIYADETCFAAGIMPNRKAKSLTKAETAKLFFQIKRILKLAVESGGSSIANYLLVDGSRGNYADYHMVYGRKGKNCLTCNTKLEGIKIGGRSTVYCPTCQK
jgi:formamidopyrimidine-DNA glycosylase